MMAHAFEERGKGQDLVVDRLRSCAFATPRDLVMRDIFGRNRFQKLAFPKDPFEPSMGQLQLRKICRQLPSLRSLEPVLTHLPGCVRFRAPSRPLANHLLTIFELELQPRRPENTGLRQP
jgi:hypothetical protein